MNEKEKNVIRKIVVMLYQKKKISFEEQMNVLALLREEDACSEE